MAREKDSDCLLDERRRLLEYVLEVCTCDADVGTVPAASHATRSATLLGSA